MDLQNSSPSSYPGAACRLPVVIALTGMKRSSIYARLSPRSPYYDPKFPRPFALFGTAQKRGAKAWRVSEVLAWIDAQAEKRGETNV